MKPMAVACHTGPRRAWPALFASMICQRTARVGKVSVASTTETRNQPSWAFAISRPMTERDTPRRAR